jgi:hypothetical protein
MQQGPVAPRALPRFVATSSLAAAVSSSVDFLGLPVIRLTCSTAFAMGRGRFLQLLDMSLSPCCPSPPRRSGKLSRSAHSLSCCLRPGAGGSASGSNFYRGHHWVHVRCGPVTRSPSSRWLRRSASSVSFPPRMRPKLRRFLTFPPVGLTPTEHASLSWTHCSANIRRSHRGPRTECCRERSRTLRPERRLRSASIIDRAE